MKKISKDFVEGMIMFVLGSMMVFSLLVIFEPYLKGIIKVPDIVLENWTTLSIIAIPSGGGYKAYTERKKAELAAKDEDNKQAPQDLR